MRRIRGMIFGLTVGIPLGLWFGFNLGKDRPILSNPFEEATIQESIKQTGENLIEKGGEVLEKSGQALQRKAKQQDEPSPPPTENPPE